MSTAEKVNNIIMGNDGKNGKSVDNYIFYMIPQKLTDNNVQVKITFSDGKVITSTLKGDWKPGTTKTYALSEETSDWHYYISVSSPSGVDASNTMTGDYRVESHRTDPISGRVQSVPWKVVSYQESTDNGRHYSGETTKRPAWLTSLSKESGNGNTTMMDCETGHATIEPNIIDRLAEYNKVLQEAPERGTKDNPYDLSMYDFRGEKYPNGMNTANCYLISAPGWYKIPLVYGNGIVGGRENENAYSTKSDDITTYHFRDHDGDLIKSPYINVQSWGHYADHAEIVWTDQPSIVDNLSVKVTTDPSLEEKNRHRDSYLKFHVSKENIRNGNAVICVKNQHNRDGVKNVTMWSWHLWFALPDALETVQCNKDIFNYYDFAKQLLGFTYREWKESASDKPRTVRVKVKQTIANGKQKQYSYIVISQNTAKSVKKFSSTLYQFGNKNAYPSIKFDKNAADEHIADGELKTSGGDDMSFANSIKYPELYYTNGSGWKDNYGQYNLWSMYNTSGDSNYSTVDKTIFDPCPEGFHVPPAKAFTCFTTTDNFGGLMKVSGDWDKGWHFKKNDDPNTTLFLPSPDCITENGWNYTLEKTLSYWSFNPSSTEKGYSININNTKVNEAPCFRACGLPILPAKNYVHFINSKHKK